MRTWQEDMAWVLLGIALACWKMGRLLSPVEFAGALGAGLLLGFALRRLFPRARN